MKHGRPMMTSGKTFAPELPEQLDRSEPPIIIGEVVVKLNHIQNPCVLTTYSEFIQFTLFGLNPKLRICYRLIRKGRGDAQVLQEWDFLYESTDRIGVGDIDTIQPTVLTVCDCFHRPVKGPLTYQLQIVEIETNGIPRYGLRNQLITATVIREESEKRLEGSK